MGQEGRNPCGCCSSMSKMIMGIAATNKQGRPAHWSGRVRDFWLTARQYYPGAEHEFGEMVRYLYNCPR
jgi:hypothetical protein